MVTGAQGLSCQDESDVKSSGGGSDPVSGVHGGAPSCQRGMGVRVAVHVQEVVSTVTLLPAGATVAVLHRRVVYDRSQAGMPGETKCLKCRLEPYLIVICRTRYRRTSSARCGNIRRRPGSRGLDRGRLASVTIRGNVLTLRYYVRATVPKGERGEVDAARL